MDDLVRNALWRQFGAAVDTLDDAITACPSSMWTQRLWMEPPLDSAAAAPDEPYTKDVLSADLTSLRGRCQATLLGLSEGEAQRTVDYPWARGETVSYLELLVYAPRHVQEHAAQLSLLLGQHPVPGTEREWVPVARAADPAGT